MAEIFRYELWNGKEVIGYYTSYCVLLGSKLIFHELSALKERYDIKPKIIEVPIIGRVVSHDHQDLTVRTCLDVRRKSKRQIEKLKTR